MRRLPKMRHNFPKNSSKRTPNLVTPVAPFAWTIIPSPPPPPLQKKERERKDGVFKYKPIHTCNVSDLQELDFSLASGTLRKAIAINEGSFRVKIPAWFGLTRLELPAWANGLKNSHGNALKLTLTSSVLRSSSSISTSP